MTTAKQKDYREEYLEKQAKKDELAKGLSDDQRNAITAAFKTLREAEWSLQEMFDITIEDARSISRSESVLKNSFPELCNIHYECD
tara:strand:+ start:1645 stop:1902 length:258 start_codon:yes stop_codon:yes gene_type:complete